MSHYIKKIAGEKTRRDTQYSSGGTTQHTKNSNAAGPAQTVTIKKYDATSVHPAQKIVGLPKSQKKKK